MSFDQWFAQYWPDPSSKDEAFRAYEQVARDTAELCANRPNPPAAVADERDAAGRSPTDYALEFAEYLAIDAEHLLAAMTLEDEARLTFAEDDSDDDTGQTRHQLGIAMDEASAARWESVNGLREGIYEFRKRRDRAAAIKASEGTT